MSHQQAKSINFLYTCIISVIPLISMFTCLIYIGAYSIFLYVTNNEVIPLIASTYLIAMCILSLSLGLRKTFSVEIARNIIEKFSLLASAFLVFQVVMYNVCGKITEVIPQDFIYETDSFIAATSTVAEILRWSSFFVEPSHFAQYVIIGVASALFPPYSVVPKPKYKTALFCSTCIILTTSGIGILLCIVTWTYWFFFYKSKENIFSSRFLSFCTHVLMVLIIMIMLYFVALQFEITHTAINRIFGTGGLESGFHGRMWSYVIYKNLNLFQKIFGTGSLNPGYYMTSFVACLYAFGIVGTTLILCSSLMLYKHTNGFYRCLVIIYNILFFVSYIFTPIGIAFYYSLIISGTVLKRSQQKIK
ncbi:MAG: hypothetical protein Q4B70_15470 [Lachnospiraceae bacterium]|nr:hypothetical protein [Lachnospiraceae bacterium]